MKTGFLETLKTEHPIALGPMAGVTDLPFRMLCREQGCDLFYTEMVSAKALHYHNQSTKLLLRHEPSESPIGVQLFGSDPDIIAETALSLEDDFDFIDLNMGCPVPKIVKNGEGSALLLKPELVSEILKKLVRTVRKPVSVKIRKSFKRDGEEGLLIAKIAEDAGVSMIAVHGRSREDYYSGAADLQAIRRIKEAVSVPVIGNGDIRSGADALRMFRETGCDGVMAARAAEGNPWIFREIRAVLDGKEVPPRPDPAEIADTALRHLDLLIAEKGPYIGTLEMRKHAAWYLSGQKNAAEMRREISTAPGPEKLREILIRFRDSEA